MRISFKITALRWRHEDSNTNTNLRFMRTTPHLQGKLGSPPQERTRLIKNYTSSLHVNMLANLQFDAQDQNFTITRPDIRHVPYWPFTHHWLWIIHVMMHSKLDATKFQQKRTTIRMMRDSSLLGSNFHHNHPFFSWLNDAGLVFTQIVKASVMSVL